MWTLWIYRQTEPELYTVGHYSPDGKWQTDSDHGSKEEASDRVAFLNGTDFALRKDHLEIAKLLSNVGIEHSGFKMQAPRVQMLIDRLRNSQQKVIAFARERNELRQRVKDLESQLAEGCIFIEHDDRPADHIQPESRPLGSHYDYVDESSAMPDEAAFRQAIQRIRDRQKFQLDYEPSPSAQDYVEGCKP